MESLKSEAVGRATGQRMETLRHGERGQNTCTKVRNAPWVW